MTFSSVTAWTVLLATLTSWHAGAAIVSTDTNPSYVMGSFGVGTNAPGATLDIVGGIRAGSSTVVNAACAGGNEGTFRYNYTSHLPEICNGTAWSQLPLQPPGTVTPVTASGPAAAIYAPTSATCNYSPAYGACGNLINGVWPANGTTLNSNTSCLSLPGAGPSQVVIDLGSTRTIGHTYASFLDHPGYFQASIAFSNDNLTYTSSFTISPTGATVNAMYYPATLAPTQSARYVRVVNGASNNTASYNMICQFAVGP